MGMCTIFDYEEIKIKNVSGLKDFKRLWEKYKNDDYSKCISKKGEISFNAWDEYKIQGYWYDDMCLFLRELAYFIEGEVYWTYEEGQEVIFIFKNNKTIVKIQKREFDEYDVDALSNKKLELDEDLAVDLDNLKLLEAI